MKERHHCQLLEIALATVVDAVIGTDAHDHITFFNPAAESMTGWRSSEALGKPLTQVFFLIDQENDKVIDSPLDRVKHLDAATTGMTHAAVVNRRGLQVEIEYTAVAMRDPHGRFAGAVIVSRARRQTAEIALQTTNESLLANAEALFEEKERAQVTLNSIGDAVISTNFSGQVSYLNIVAEKMTGWVQADASGSAVDEIFRLVDTTTHETIPCPTAQAIIENRRISLEAVCVLIRRDRDEIAVEVSAAPIHDRNGGVIGAVMVAHDVTAARELSMKLARLALHDSLTDLPNRALFNDRLSQATATAQANGGYAALLYVDLDRFKHINDSLGHATGDKLLFCLPISSISRMPWHARKSSWSRWRRRTGSVSMNCACPPASAWPYSPTMPGKRRRCCAAPTPRCIRPSTTGAITSSSSIPRRSSTCWSDGSAENTPRRIALTTNKSHSG